MKTNMLWPSALVVALLGCGGVEVVVESNTSWWGDICITPYCVAGEASDHELRGSGSKSFTQGGQSGDEICYWFGNVTDTGYVRVYIKDSGLFGSDKNAEHKNTASHGAVSACWTQ
jgi:hypothetical protein